MKEFEYKDKVKIPKLAFVDDMLDITKCGTATKEMNEYTTDALNKRKLQLSKDKCVRMHVASKKAKKKKQGSDCETVLIDEWKTKKVKKEESVKLEDEYSGKVELKTVESHLYLGDLVKSDGSNRDNVLAKAAKGRAIARDILFILNDVYLGEFFFQALILLRESLLLSVLTSNLEVSLNITAHDLKILNDVDLMLLRGALKLSAKSSQCLIFLELGISSVEYTLKKKRLFYLFHLLTVTEPSLAKMVFDQQVQRPCKDDWANLVKKDLKDLNICLSFAEILLLSKRKFKAIVKSACKDACFRKLLSQKQKLSKGSEIDYIKFETQSYLKPGHGLPTETMRKIYHTRYRETYLKCNFPAQFSDKRCLSPCVNGEDREKHIFHCIYFSNRNEISPTNV